MPRLLVLGLLIALTFGCSPLAILGSPAPTDKAPYTVAPPTPTLSPIASVARTGHGRPYTAEMIAAELLDVPYDFPPELQTEFIAAAVADRILTYDGRPYREISVTGSCNEPVRTRCDLTLEGLPAFAPTRDDTDTYWFAVDLGAPILGPGSGQVLRGFPADFAPAIDALTRSLDGDGLLKTEALRSIEWTLPPPDDAFVLTYGDDNEGDTMIFVTIDRGNRQILSIETRVCCG